MITSLHVRLNCGTSWTKIKMDVGINSVVQSLLNVDLGQFSDSLFALADRRKTETTNHEDLVEENSEDETSAAYCRKTAVLFVENSARVQIILPHAESKSVSLSSKFPVKRIF